ncbi:MAG: polynucleotide adenylyltransferase PcnB [Spirochaetia bacterium]|nr:polynucleotide adenylyltransferase PcnB [Spirochaetia bacterium]MBQ3647934.1 polynucleotide adenylyltransferase PcnB [Spirochaetia bacterium]MBQ3712483.1 polynucleotide adenylyltransferase PcnB [Spirochaetia bacterium]MBQ6673249.1 polynucleotide adenylyltransferase PcnB [Spirochaetia bacterium]
MIVRYYKNTRGKAVKLAEFYEKHEHNIHKEDIDHNALYICERLRNAGYESYIVGGAVRDMIIGRKPKDFDIVTDAYPRQIKKLFRNARIIGRRFLLVHVMMGGTIYEISTFRAANSVAGDNNCFGTIREDVWRRDFSINALYYSPKTEQVVDFVGGFRDLLKRIVRPVIPLRKIFLEDPVRLIRAAKFSVMIGGDIPLLLKLFIVFNAHRIVTVSSSRLTEEIFKIMKMDSTTEVFRKLARLNILRYILPGVYEIQKKSLFYDTMEKFDQAKEENRLDLSKVSTLLEPLITDYLEAVVFYDDVANQTIGEVMDQVKTFLRPIIPPNAALLEAIKSVMSKEGFKLRYRRPKKKADLRQPDVSARQPGVRSGSQSQD